MVLRSNAMRRSTYTLILVLSLTAASAAFAANEKRNKPSQYQEVTDEDRAAARERARTRVSTWNDAALPPEYSFPWMQLGFVALALGIATPIAWIAYRNSSKELKEVNAFAQQQPRKRAAKPAIEE